MKFKNIAMRLGKYVIIGGLTTGGMWITWNLLYFLSRSFSFDSSIAFSLTQYIASELWIIPSFYLNRKFTFKDKTLSHSRTITLAKIILIYNLAPIVASSFTYVLQKLFNLDIERASYDVNIFGSLYSIPYVYLSLQVVGIGLGLIINFLGQYYFVYTSKNKQAERANSTIYS